MIRNIGFILFVFFLAFSGRSIGQCTPDTSLKSSGFIPKTLAHAQTGIAYSETISVLTPRDTTVYFGSSPVAVKIDSIKALTVQGLPVGITYQCLNSKCVFVWNEVRCILLSGTTSQSGTFPLEIPVITYAKFGTTPISRPDTLRQFSLVVDGPNKLNSIVDDQSLNVFPNPTSDIIWVQAQNISPNEKPLIIDLRGSRKEVTAAYTNGRWNLDVSSLTPGFYILFSDGQTRLVEIVRND